MRLSPFFAASLALLIAAPAILSSPAQAETKKRVVSQTTNAQPRARIKVQPRSFLDPGTEVLPGERKFTDYAIPPNYSPTAVIDNTAFSRPSALPGPFDLPGRRNPYPWQWGY
jgi:hypothetical protein